MICEGKTGPAPQSSYFILKHDGSIPTKANEIYLKLKILTEIDAVK
jgi:hypothetical protein